MALQVLDLESLNSCLEEAFLDCRMVGLDLDRRIASPDSSILSPCYCSCYFEDLIQQKAGLDSEPQILGPCLELIDY